MPEATRGGVARRRVLGAGAALIGWDIAPAAAQEKAPGPVAEDIIVVTLLGTGDPQPRSNRYGMSTPVQAGGLVTALRPPGKLPTPVIRLVGDFRAYPPPTSERSPSRRIAAIGNSSSHGGDGFGWTELNRR
jgi:hypothetical protein